MNQSERIYRIHALLRDGKPVSRRRIEELLERSRATVTRDIEYMRDFFDAPIIFDRVSNGYLYDPTSPQFELPGLWFNASELHALLACEQLLEEVQPGLLAPQLEPLRRRIEQILESEPLGRGEVAKRVRILRMAARSANDNHFQTAAHALLTRHQMRIGYHGRGSGDQSERSISPLRLVHYRDNWYLDAWCHLKHALRSFALERVTHAQALEQPAEEVPEQQLTDYYTTSYGIFSGHPEHAAVLRFSPERARWIADEKWHSEQVCQWLPDGSYQLSVPYSDPRELVLDILKYGPDVEVLAPPALRDEVVSRLRRALEIYHSPGISQA